MTLPFFGATGAYNADFYGLALGQLLRSSRLYDNDRALARDPEVYDRLRRDPVVGFCLRYRKLLSAGTDWHLEAASPRPDDRRCLKIFEDLLKEIEYEASSRFNLAEAIIAGSRWGKIERERIKLRVADLEPMHWWIARQIRDVDKRRFRQWPVDHPTTTRDVDQLSPTGDTVASQIPQWNREFVWQIYRPLQRTWENVDRDEYIRHVYDDREDTLGYGGGLASELYTFWFAKEVVLQQGLQYLERWAQGILIAKVDTLREGNASIPTSTQRMTDWLSVLERMRSRHVLVHDARDDIKVVDAPTGGWQAFMEALEYLDGAMKTAILGATLPTAQKVKHGSFAMADIQEGTTEAITRFDQAGLEETLRRDLLGWLWRENYQNFSALGLQNCTLPFIRLRSDRRSDHAGRVDIILKARQAGLTIRKDEAYAQLGFTPPAEGDEILPPLGQTESERQVGIPKKEAEEKTPLDRAREEIKAPFQASP